MAGLLSKIGGWLGDDTNRLKLAGASHIFGALDQGQSPNVAPFLGAIQEQKDAQAFQDSLGSEDMMGRFSPEERSFLAGLPPQVAQKLIGERIFAQPDPMAGKEVINNKIVDVTTGQVLGDYSTPEAPKQSSSAQKFEELVALGYEPAQAIDMAYGGNRVTVNNQIGGGNDLRKKLSEKEGEQWAGFMDAGGRAGALTQDMELLSELVQQAPQGPVTGRLASAFPGVNSAADAFESVVKRVAPSLREEGSGSTSDIEYDGMLKSLPALRNRPEANAAIIGMMQAKQQIMMEKAGAVAAYQNGEATEQETRTKLRELDSRSIMTPELQALIGATGGGTSQPDTAVPQGVDPTDWEYMTPEERALFQ